MTIVGINLRNKKRSQPSPQKEVAYETKKETKNDELLFAEAEKYFKKGELHKAKESYEKIVKDYAGSEIARKAEEKLGETNMKILFCPFDTEDSEVYKVKKGDSLFLLAKKFDTTVDLIKKINNLENNTIYFNQRLKIPTVKFSIFIDKSNSTLTLKAGDRMFKKYFISTGKNNSTPEGEFTITSKLINPVWYFNGKVIPARNSENILGSRWLGLSIEGYGIHGTVEPETIGKQITHGCIRMRNKDVEELYSIVPMKTKVVIVH